MPRGRILTFFTFFGPDHAVTAYFTFFYIFFARTTLSSTVAQRATKQMSVAGVGRGCLVARTRARRASLIMDLARRRPFHLGILRPDGLLPQFPGLDARLQKGTRDDALRGLHAGLPLDHVQRHLARFPMHCEHSMARGVQCITTHTNVIEGPRILGLRRWFTARVVFGRGVLSLRGRPQKRQCHLALLPVLPLQGLPGGEP